LAVLIALLPYVFGIGTSVVHGLVVGFQTRGDQRAIQEAALKLQGSALFLGGIILVTALLVLWAAYGLGKRVGNRAVLHVTIAVIVGIVLRLILTALLAPADRPIIDVRWIVEQVVYVVVAYGGTALGGKSVSQVSN
jgi:hypothetical protein